MISERADRIVVRLRLIGYMEAWTAAGENLLPVERLTRAILAIIALAAPRPVSRAWLSDLFGIERGADADRGSLRREARLLAQALGPAGEGVLLATRDTLALRPGGTWTDVQEIQRASVARPEALSLLDGELLAGMDGITPAFDTWLTRQREALRDAALGIANAALLTAKTPDATIVGARRLLLVDPLHEGAWRALMRAHAARGDHEMAMRAFEQCRVTLSTRLDTAPSSATLALLSAIRPSPTGDRPMVSPDVRAADRGKPSWPRVGIPPMRHIGPDQIQVPAGDGLSDHLAAALKRFLNFVVIGPDVLEQVSPDCRDEAETWRALGIDYVVDGTVQCDGQRVRMSLRLYDTRDHNRIIWAERFDRVVTDPPRIRREIAADVVARIEPELRLIEAQRHSDPSAEPPGARTAAAVDCPDDAHGT